tara:strand:+ start:234 stop:419 length:186 start_codon:yes stop_codon:yes gene_type:complete
MKCKDCKWWSEVPDPNPALRFGICDDDFANDCVTLETVDDEIDYGRLVTFYEFGCIYGKEK